MKTHFNLLILLLVLINFPSVVKSQDYNLSTIENVNHIGRAFIGINSGIVYGLHYAKPSQLKKITYIPFIESSLPMGKTLFDDNKLEIGSSVIVLNRKFWKLSYDLSLLHRQNKNPFVNMQSFGYNTGVKFGYYRQKCFGNIEISNENAFMTHLKHTEVYKGNYLNVVDGWYQNTANYLMFGFGIGYSFKKMDITLHYNKEYTFNLKNTPTVPFNIIVGFNYKFFKN